MCLSNQIRSDEEKEISPPEIVEETPTVTMFEGLVQDYEVMLQEILERVKRIYTKYRKCLQRVKKILRNWTSFNPSEQERQELTERIKDAVDKMYCARSIILEMVGPSAIADLDAEIDQQVQQEDNTLTLSLMAQLC
ncbi:uncharacterized protein LOC118433882 [Folsomia candida]|uniref:uncharacterized protein LOC118433882 n=1 Tax=Folsomia candida TaxID=158441 RepID=UPI001604B22C|nr:uncharacterized protein LOC118433882 [Folsomia candida]